MVFSLFLKGQIVDGVRERRQENPRCGGLHAFDVDSRSHLSDVGRLIDQCNIVNSSLLSTTID
jgi:hypothetical protein